MSGRGLDVGMDPEKLGVTLAPRWDFIHDLDMEKHK